MSKYRKIPVEVDAQQWFPEQPHPQVIPAYAYYKHRCSTCNYLMNTHGMIHTLEGIMTVCPGDWIIKGVIGEHYPCKPLVFAQTYEIVIPKP